MSRIIYENYLRKGKNGTSFKTVWERSNPQKHRISTSSRPSKDIR